MQFCTRCVFSALAMFACGCNSDGRLPAMVKDPEAFVAVPRDAEEAAEWKRVLDPRNRIEIVRLLNVEFGDAAEKKLNANKLPLKQAVSILVTVQIVPGIKSIPKAGRIAVYKRKADGKRQFETDGYSDIKLDDVKSGRITFESKMRVVEAGEYNVEFRLHHYVAPLQTVNVVAG